MAKPYSIKVESILNEKKEIYTYSLNIDCSEYHYVFSSPDKQKIEDLKKQFEHFAEVIFLGLMSKYYAGELK